MKLDIGSPVMGSPKSKTWRLMHLALRNNIAAPEAGSSIKDVTVMVFWQDTTMPP